MNSIDETMLLSLYANTKQNVIAQEIFESYNLTNPSAIRAAIRCAAWRGFVAGLEATNRYYENKE